MTDQPLKVASIALRNFEALMATYEAARRGETIHLPLQEKGFPLEKMVAEGKA